MRRRGSVDDAVLRLASAVALRPRPSSSSQAAPLDSRHHAAATGRGRRDGGERGACSVTGRSRKRAETPAGGESEGGLGSLAGAPPPPPAVRRG